MELAGYGTVHFDEFGKLLPEHNRYFNSILEKNDRKYNKLGYDEPIKADCHFIATMKEDISTLTDDHKRRFRILEVSSLEDRKEDKVPLFKFFVKKKNTEQSPPTSIIFDLIGFKL